MTTALLLAGLVAVFPIVTVVAAATDFFTMTISNRLSAALVVAALAALAIAAPGWGVVGGHFAAAGIVFAAGFGCFAFGWMGGGDVKFATALALWLGFDRLLEFAVGFSLWGGLLTLLVLAADRALQPLPALRVGFLTGFPEHRRIPYGIALAAAGLQIFPSTPWFAHLAIG